MDRPKRRLDASRWQQIAEAGHVGVPLARELIGHDGIRARAVAIVERVVIAAPEPAIE
jgi:hypothetical protein